MKKGFLCIGLAFFIGAFIGCKKDNPTETEIEYTIENYWPLAVGNKWVTVDTSWNGVDTTTSIDSGYVAESYEWNGKTVWCMKGSGSDSWCVVYNNEIRVYQEPPNDTLLYNTILKEPLEVGQKWAFIAFEGNTAWAEIESKTASLTVPAGTFKDCLKISVYAADSLGFPSFKWWSAPNIGCIRDYRDNQDSGYDNKLIRYEIK